MSVTVKNFRWNIGVTRNWGLSKRLNFKANKWLEFWRLLDARIRVDESHASRIMYAGPASEL